MLRRVIWALVILAAAAVAALMIVTPTPPAGGWSLPSWFDLGHLAG